MTLQEAQQLMVDTESELRRLLETNPRTAEQVDKLCQQYHTAYFVYQFHKAKGD